MNICEAGHIEHGIMMVDTVQGSFVIFDYEQYMDFKGYCTGQDDISRTLDLYGNWSIEIYNLIDKILSSDTEKKLFIDVGCHIGWFSKLAKSKGFKVIGFDGDIENLELAEVNVPDEKFVPYWFDGDTLPAEIIYESELMKIDIEGNEKYSIVFFENSLKAGSIKNIIMEISPVFNDSYPGIVEKMKGWGYDVLLTDGTEWDGSFNFNQTDFWFKLKN